MLEIAARLPPGALIGGEDLALSEAAVRSGGARFVAREADLVRSDGRITGWQESRTGVVAPVSGPNTGNSRFEAGPPGAVICTEKVNCGFTLPGFAPEVEQFTVALIYRSEGEAKTLASIFTGQTNNMIFLSESDGRIFAQDRMNSVAIALPMAPAARPKLVILAYDGRSLRLLYGGHEAMAVAKVPGLAHQADFFFGCRSNRPGLAKTQGNSRLHEVMFWPDRSLLHSAEAENAATLTALGRHFRWTY
jgi:hypothetical protein